MKSKLLPLFFLLLFLLSVQVANAQLRVVDNKGSILKVDPSKWVVGVNGIDIYNKNIDNSGKVGVGTKTPAATLHNAGSTVLGMTVVTNSTASYSVPSATVDGYSGLVVTQSATDCALSLPTPTDATAGRVFTVSNTSSSSNMLTANSCAIPAGYSANFVWNGSNWSGPNSGSASVPLSGLTAATATNTIDNTNFNQNWNWNSATTGSPLTLGSSSLTSGNLLSLTTGNASQTGSALALTTNTTGGSALQINATGAYTATTGLLNLAANAATTGTAMGITANGLTGGTGLNLATSSTALTTANLLKLSSTGAATSATGYLADISNTASATTGGLLQATSNSIAAPSNGLVHYNFLGAHSNSGMQIDDATATGNAMTLNANMLTSGSALKLSSTSVGLTTGSLLNASGVVAAGTTKGLINIINTAALTTGTVAIIQANSIAGSGVTILANGRVGIGTLAPTSTLEVSGAAVNTAPTAGTTATIDFSVNNLAYTSYVAASPAFTLNNMEAGGAYTLVLTGTTNTGTAAFTATGFTVKYMGTTTLTSGKTHIYSFIVLGTSVYVSMATEN